MKIEETKIGKDGYKDISFSYIDPEDGKTVLRFFEGDGQGSCIVQSASKNGGYFGYELTEDTMSTLMDFLLILSGKRDSDKKRLMAHALPDGHTIRGVSYHYAQLCAKFQVWCCKNGLTNDEAYCLIAPKNKAEYFYGKEWDQLNSSANSKIKWENVPFFT